MTDLRRRTFGPHPTAQDWRAASKADIEKALAAEVIRRNPKLYSGYDEDAVKFVRNTMGPTKWDLLLSAESYGLAPQGTYLWPSERKSSSVGSITHHATKKSPAELQMETLNTQTCTTKKKSAAQLQREIDEAMNRRALEGVLESEAARLERLEDD